MLASRLLSRLPSRGFCSGHPRRFRSFSHGGASLCSTSHSAAPWAWSCVLVSMPASQAWPRAGSDAWEMAPSGPARSSAALMRGATPACASRHRPGPCQLRSFRPPEVVEASSGAAARRRRLASPYRWDSAMLPLTCRSAKILEHRPPSSRQTGSPTRSPSPTTSLPRGALRGHRSGGVLGHTHEAITY